MAVRIEIICTDRNGHRLASAVVEGSTFEFTLKEQAEAYARFNRDPHNQSLSFAGPSKERGVRVVGRIRLTRETPTASIILSFAACSTTL